MKVNDVLARKKTDEKTFDLLLRYTSYFVLIFFPFVLKQVQFRFLRLYYSFCPQNIQLVDVANYILGVFAYKLISTTFLTKHMHIFFSLTESHLFVFNCIFCIHIYM